MAYVRPDGRVRVRAFARPMPRYDFEPTFAEDPDEEGLRLQAADLIARAIRIADGDGLVLEEGDAVDERWRIDWGQKMASGTYRQEIRKLLEDVPPEYIAKILLRSFYRSVMELISLGDESLTCLMGIHTLEGLVTNPAPEIDNLKLCFSAGDEIPDEFLSGDGPWNVSLGRGAEGGTTGDKEQGDGMAEADADSNSDMDTSSNESNDRDEDEDKEDGR